MRGSRKNLLVFGGMTCMLTAVMLTGCAGPSTKVLPRADLGQAVYDVPEEIPVLEEANPFYLQEALTILSAVPRLGGSKAEGDAARYMEQLMSDYGYRVERQRFREEHGPLTVTGTNVEAVREASDAEADILIVCAHLDTKPDSPGANDSAAGIAAMLETARLLSKLPTDTEVRFVAFSGHETGGDGVRYYADSLTRKERERIIGVVNLDDMGYISDSKLVLGTADGNPTCLGDQLRGASRNILGENWPYQIRRDVEIGNFRTLQIPVVTLGQSTRSFESGTDLDCVEIVDIERVAQTVDVLSQAVSELMSTDSPSMIAKARYYNDYRDASYTQETEELLWFGESQETVENYVGIRGILDVTNQDAAGRLIEKYQFRMKWFQVDQIIISDYYFLDGKLDSVVLEADQAGITFDEMKERLAAIYGEPEEKSQGPNGTEYDWRDPVYHKKFALIPASGKYSLEIRPMDGERELLEQREIDGRIISQNEGDERTPLLMALLQEIIPQEAYDKIGAVTFYRDGIGLTQSYLAPAQVPIPVADDGGQAAGSQANDAGAPGGTAALWEIGIDVDDALLSDGHFRNRTETIRNLTALYGQLLQASSPEQYQFPEENPENFSDEFASFVLLIRPSGHQDSQEAYLWPYYNRDELVAYRDWVRGELKLQSGMENIALGN